jgi:hypothetical protein
VTAGGLWAGLYGILPGVFHINRRPGLFKNMHGNGKYTRVIPGNTGRNPKKDMLFPGLFLLLFFLLAFDLGEEFIECLFPVCSHLRIDLDKVLGDLA